MSEIADSFPEYTHGFKAKYDWSKWTDGRIHELVRGVDFHTAERRFCKAAHNHSKRHGFKLRTRVVGNKVWVQFRARVVVPRAEKREWGDLFLRQTHERAHNKRSLG